jgi:DHA1 family bicyclomycin/chloramphenicol resistance-like MFS transporter
VLAGLGAASMNLVLSSLPQLQEVFGVDYHATQSLFTGFLAGAALGQLGIGPLADAFDRRTMLRLALCVFVAGSTTGALAPTLTVLTAGRVLQGLGGATCLVLAEAIVARRSAGAALARRIGVLNAGMAIAIMLAPLAGAGLAALLGWRWLLWAPAAAGLALLAWTSRLAPMAPPGGPAAPAHLLDGMGRLLRSRRFVTGTLAGGFVMANYFCLAAFGPFVAMTLHGLERVEYSLLFAALGLSYIAGNIVSGRLYARYGERRTVVAALASGVIAGAGGLALALAGALDKHAFLFVGVLIATVTGLALPSTTGRSLTAEAGSAGAAAGLFNFAIFGIGGLVTHVVGDNLGAGAVSAVAALPAVTLIALVAVLAGYGRAATT